MNTRDSRKKLKILVVEDNKADAELFCELVRDKLDCELDLVQDGELAIDYVKCRGRFAGQVGPDLVLLDLNIPKISGREVLRTIKEDADLRKTPVFIFTSSGAERDVKECYELSANCYIKKPTDLSRLDNLIQSLNSFWIEYVSFPSGKGDRDRGKSR